MTVKNLIDTLKSLGKDHQDDEVKIWDADTEQLEPVVGLYYGGSGSVELSTKEG